MKPVLLQLKNTILFLLVFVFVLAVSSTVRAQGARVSLAGTNHAELDTAYRVRLAVDAPTDMSTVIISIVYDTDLLQYGGVSSNYISDNNVILEGDRVRLEASGNPIPADLTELGVVSFIPHMEGNTELMILSASAFSSDGFVISVDTSETLSFTILPRGTQPPETSGPITTTVAEATPNPATPSISPTQPITVPPAHTGSELTATPTILPTTVEATTSEAVLPTTEVTSDPAHEGTSEDAATTSNDLGGTRQEDSTESEETSTISSETDSSTIDNEDSPDDGSADVGINRYMTGVLVILLLIVIASIIVITLNRKKR